MNHKELVTGYREKHYKSEFIFKLVDIMKNFPDLIRWTENGKSIQLLEVAQIQKHVLPFYFRHSKLESFIRQLHLYNFKQKKEFKSELIFQHEEFRQGNESQFTLIQRTKNKKQKLGLLKQLQNNDMLKSINDSQILSKQQKQILSTMYSYKLVVIQKQRSLRQKLSELNESIKSNRNKKITEIGNVLEDQVKLELESLKKFSKSIDIFMNETLVEREKEIKENGKKVIVEKVEEKLMEKQKASTDDLSKVEKSSYRKDVKILQKPSLTNECPQIPNHMYVIQLSGENISSNENYPMFDFQCFFQNQQVNLSKKNANSLHDQMGQQQFVPTERTNTNQVSIPLEMFAYQKQPSLLFMPLPFYNRSAGSEFFDWPNNKPHTHEEKQNNKQEVTHLSFGQSKRKLISKTKSSQEQSSFKTKKSDCKKYFGCDASEQSEISFMNQN